MLANISPPYDQNKFDPRGQVIVLRKLKEYPLDISPIPDAHGWEHYLFFEGDQILKTALYPIGKYGDVEINIPIIYIQRSDAGTVHDVLQQPIASLHETLKRFMVMIKGIHLQGFAHGAILYRDSQGLNASAVKRYQHAAFFMDTFDYITAFDTLPIALKEVYQKPMQAQWGCNFQDYILAIERALQEPLFKVPATHGEELDKEEFSQNLQQEFEQNGIVFSNEGAASNVFLEAGKGKVVTINVVELGRKWHVNNSARSQKYEIVAKKNELEIYSDCKQALKVIAKDWQDFIRIAYYVHTNSSDLAAVENKLDRSYLRSQFFSFGWKYHYGLKGGYSKWYRKLKRLRNLCEAGKAIK